MDVKEAIEVLKHHNVWRRGEDESAIMTNPKRLGIAIDTVIIEFENLFISGVVKSFYCYDKTVANAEEDFDFKQCKKQCEKCKAI